MRTDLDIYTLAGDVDGGCGFYRIREPARVAQDNGLNVTVQTELPVDASVSHDKKMIIHSIGVTPDIIVFQRPLLEAFFVAIQYLQARGVACVVEIDDDLAGTHVLNIAYASVNPKTNRTENWEWLLKCCAIADLVITSSDELARRYAPHGRSRVLRNCIPESEFNREKVLRECLRVGWTGTVGTHPQDLDITEGHVGAALNNFADNKDFYVVGDGQLVKEKLRVPGEVIATGWVPRDKYIDTVNKHIDIGIVPLKLDRFNQCKSGLKSLEMASQGIPSVVSPTIENRLLSKMTDNPLAIKTKDWQKHLKPLLTNRDFYLERSQYVRESVRHLTYENQIDGWIQAWSDAFDNRRQKMLDGT